MKRHLREAVMQGKDVSYFTRDTYSDVFHPAMTHTASCQVQVGTRRVLDHYE